MSTQHYIIIGAVLLLNVWLAWTEYRRANHARWLWRIIAVTVALWCLTLFVLPVPWDRKQYASSAAILLTDGYERDSLSVLKNKIGSATPVYTADNFLSADSSVTEWHVAGYGLDKEQLGYFLKKHLFFHPSSPVNGVVAAHWQQEMAGGQPFVIQGKCVNTQSAPMQLVLEAYQSVQDSIMIRPNSESTFTLHANPKHNGRAVYHLKIKQGNKWIEDDPVPVNISAPSRTRILALASSPDFEYRFLSKWLGESGYPLVMRTRTSREKYEQAFINHTPIQLQNINSALLDSIDVVLADISSVDALSEGERASLAAQVSSGGMGLLLRADTMVSSGFYSGIFRLQPVPGNVQQTITPSIPGSATALSPLPVEQPIVLQIPATARSMVRDAAGRSLTAASLYGSGKLGMTTLNNTYHWLLQGQNAIYAAYWSHIIEQFARKSGIYSAIVSPGIYSINQPVPVTVLHENAKDDKLVLNGSTSLQLQQQSLPFAWQGIYWPLNKGWQEISTGDNLLYTYIYDAKDWPALKAFQRLKVTRNWISNHPSNSLSGLSIQTWNTVLFVTIFLAAASFLWIERKFFS